jgi:hypothetical protein
MSVTVRSAMGATNLVKHEFCSGSIEIFGIKAISVVKGASKGRTEGSAAFRI